MKNVLWVALLVLISLVVLMLTLTFMQPEFRKEVGANFLFLHTPAVPVYTYVFAAFIAGVLIGTLPLLAAYAGARREVARKTATVRKLEANLVKAGEATRNFPGSGINQSVSDKESA